MVVSAASLKKKSFAERSWRVYLEGVQGAKCQASDDVTGGARVATGDCGSIRVPRYAVVVGDAVLVVFEPSKIGGGLHLSVTAAPSAASADAGKPSSSTAAARTAPMIASRGKSLTETVPPARARSIQHRATGAFGVYNVVIHARLLVVKLYSSLAADIASGLRSVIIIQGAPFRQPVGPPLLVSYHPGPAMGSIPLAAAASAARPVSASALPACLHAQHHAVLRGSIVGRLAALALEAEVERRPDLEATADPVAL